MIKITTIDKELNEVILEGDTQKIVFQGGLLLVFNSENKKIYEIDLSRYRIDVESVK